MDQKTTFSVLTVSKRTGWEPGALGQLATQSVTPKEWVIVGEENVRRGYGKFVSAPKQERASNLNASLNTGLRFIAADAPDYVIFYQDFIELPTDCFEKLLALATPNTFVTTCTPNYDGSDDGRYTGINVPRPCRPEEWESNVALAPMQMLQVLGGFDEDYDNGWSWDNVNLAQRAAMIGAKFILDEGNRPTLLPHEQTSKLEMPLNRDRHNRTMSDIRRGVKPINLKYLS